MPQSAAHFEENVKIFVMPRNAFEGYDEPVNIDMEPEEALKLLLTAEPNPDGMEPVSDS